MEVKSTRGSCLPRWWPSGAVIFPLDFRRIGPACRQDRRYIQRRHRHNQRLTRELARIGHVVGKEGRIRERAALKTASESWADAMRSVNNLIEDLVHPTSEMARVIGAVAKGDLSQTMATEIEGQALEGEFLRTAKIVNTMVVSSVLSRPKSRVSRAKWARKESSAARRM